MSAKTRGPVGNTAPAKFQRPEPLAAVREHGGTGSSTVS